ncbi:MAG: hypothetical protein ABEJ92_06360 [Halobacteriales archaeon]
MGIIVNVEKTNSIGHVIPKTPAVGIKEPDRSRSFKGDDGKGM